MSNCHNRPFLSSKNITGLAIAANCKMSFNMRWSNAREIQSSPNIYRQPFMQAARTSSFNIDENRRLMSRRCSQLYKRPAATNGGLPNCSEFPGPLFTGSSNGIVSNNDLSHQFYSTPDISKSDFLHLLILYILPNVPFWCPVVPLL